jgi:hypothetical protein
VVIVPKYKFCVLSIATDRYLDYWQNMILSATQNADFKDVQVLLFTDKPENISKEIRNFFQENLVTVKISHEPWPFPTLKRFEYIVENSEQINALNVLYIDADMLFHDYFDFSHFTQILEREELILVQHPGYYRPRGYKRLRFYLTNPLQFLRDFLLILKHGSLGSWETNVDSSAFVERSHRKVYFCGGIWMGQTRVILEMSEQLSRNINSDLQENVIAIFHDESHLNRYAVEKNPTKLNPSYCFESTYSQLSTLNPVIIAVNKHEGGEWIR